MSRGEYAAGAADLAGVLGACLLAAWLIARRRLGELTGTSRVAALGVLATAALVAVHVVPLALGILSRASVLVAAAAVVVASLAVHPARGRAPEPPPAPRAPTGPVSALLAAAAVAAVVATALAIALRDAAQPSTGIDMVNIHLPDVARWVQLGTLWHVNQFVPDLAHGNYPNNGDAVLLAAVLPWRGDFLVRLSMLPFLALTGVGVHALARELRAPAGAAVLAAAVVCSVPIALESAVGAGLPDPVMWSTFAAGVLFCVRHARTGRTSDLVLAGVGLGLAFGTKWYGVSAVAVVLAVWLVAGWARGKAPRALARQGAALIGLVGLGGGIWLVRNWVESGNPIFPVRVAPFGATIFGAPHDVVRAREGFTVAGYLDDPSVWRHYLWPAYRDFLGLPALVLAVGALGAAAAALRRRRRDAWAPVVLTAAAIGIAIAYALTPYSAQGARFQPVFAGPNTRYLVPALVLAAPAAAWLMGAVRGRAPALALHAIGLLAVALGLRRAFDVGVVRPLVVAAALAGVLAVAWLVARAPAFGARRGAAAAVAVLALAGLAAAGWRDQERFAAARYRGADATIAWVDAHAPGHRRVALAGHWGQGVAPPFPMFGPRLRNRVAYLGPWVAGMLRAYAGPAPFAAALRRGRYDLLEVGRGFLAVPGAPPPGDVPEERWARALGLRQVARSDTLTLFAVGPGPGRTGRGG